MHWFASRVRNVLGGISGGLFGLCVPVLCSGTPQSESRVGGAGGQSGSGVTQERESGARLNVRSSTDGREGAARGGVEVSGVGVAPAGGEGGKKPAAAPLVIPLVQGYDTFGINLPDYDVQGRLRSLFVIGAISRLDDRSVEIRESFLETYSEDGSPEFSIDLPRAVLDRFTRVLVAKTPVTLRKAEFELKGASLEFNTVTKEGGLGGPVLMTIYNGTTAPDSKQSKESSPTSAGTSPTPPR